MILPKEKDSLARLSGAAAGGNVVRAGINRFHLPVGLSKIRDERRRERVAHRPDSRRRVVDPLLSRQRRPELAHGEPASRGERSSPPCVGEVRVTIEDVFGPKT